MNKGLADMVAKTFAVTHVPGQIYCNIHSVLMFDEESVWEDLEKKIGAEKLFPSLSHSNLDLDSLLVSVQCLDGLTNFVSPDKSMEPIL